MGEALSLEEAWNAPAAKVQRLDEVRIMDYWPHIARELDRVPHIWQPYWTKEYLQSTVLAGGMQMWSVGTSSEVKVIVWTQIAHYPACRVLQVVLAIGNSIDEGLSALENTLHSFAQNCGCEYCEVIGRAGWWSRLKHMGFRRQNVVYVRKIENRSVN